MFVGDNNGNLFIGMSWMIMRVIDCRCHLLFLLLAVLLIITISVCSADVQASSSGSSSSWIKILDAKIGELEFEAEPSAGAPNETIALRVQFKVQTTCPYPGAWCGLCDPCPYPVRAHDVKVTISLPQNLRIIEGANPQSWEYIETTIETTVTAAWLITANATGTYDIFVKVTTRDAGTLTGALQLRICKGASVSKPIIIPEKPVIGKPIYIRVEVNESGGPVEEVLLYYKLSKNTDWQIVNFSRLSIYENVWIAKIMPIYKVQNTHKITIEFYVYTRNVHDEELTTTTYKIVIEAMEYIKAMCYKISMIMFAVGIIGSIGIIYGGYRYRNLRLPLLPPVTTKGLHMLGGKRVFTASKLSIITPPAFLSQYKLGWWSIILIALILTIIVFLLEYVFCMIAL
jgi:hypothetical protein